MHTVAPGGVRSGSASAEATTTAVPARALSPATAAGPTGEVPRLPRSIATVSLPDMPLGEKLEVAKRAGFDGVEICDSDLRAGCVSPAEVRRRAWEMRRRAADLELRILMYQPFRDYESVPDEVLRDSLRRAEQAFGLMGDLGTDMLLVCSNVSAAAVDDDKRAADQLRRLAQRASLHGVRVAYEALAWGRYVSDYLRAWKLVSAADHPALGICLDSFHILALAHDPSAIRHIPGEKIFFVQLADAPAMTLDTRTWSRHHRCFPGQGVFDLAGFAAAVRASGTRCPLSLEIFSDELRHADPDRAAAEGMQSLLMLEASIA